MNVRGLDHVNILTGDMDRTAEFLRTVLGLEDGARPAFRSPGYWLYRDGKAIVHISDAGDKERTRAGDASLGDPALRAKPGRVDHVAFRCSGYRETMDRLRELGITSHQAEIPGTGGDVQVFIDSPDDVSFELIFAAADVAAGTPAASTSA